MATRTDAGLKVEIELNSLDLMLADLPEVSEEWSHLPEGERVSWSRDWDQLMGSLRAVLEPAYRAGSMTIEQRERYRRILCALETSLPTLERIGLYTPPMLLGV